MIPIIGIIISAYDCRPMILALRIRGHAGRHMIHGIIREYHSGGMGV